MPIDILNRQKDILIRRSIARSYIKKTEKDCPVCPKKKKMSETMKMIQKQFQVS